jgi:hypothetical protein
MDGYVKKADSFLTADFADFGHVVSQVVFLHFEK